MSNIKLTYFDFDGGRGEAARITLAGRKIAFEDDRISFQQLGELKAKKTLPFGAVPVIEIDGTIIAQSNAINRYVGKLADLYPKDSLAALYCDEAMDTVEDAISKFVLTFGIEDQEELKAKREALIAGPFTTVLTGLERQLSSRGGKFFDGSSFSVADIVVFVWLKGLRKGHIDYVPTDIVKTIAPKLDAYYGQMKNQEVIASYYSSRGGL
jgi:prostaglandin-H2 D-isomerase / glutathione transferase